MPNYSTREELIVHPVWVVNTSTTPVKWSYDSEYSTFNPGEVVCMDITIAHFFAGHLPALKVLTEKPTKKIEIEDVAPVSNELDEQTDVSDRPIADLTYAELRVFCKQRGINSVGKKKEELVKLLMDEQV